MRHTDLQFNAVRLRENIFRATRCCCLDDTSSTTTASQPVANVTGAGSPTSQGDNSPVTTGQAVRTGDNKGGHINTGTQVNTGIITPAGSTVVTGTQVNTKTDNKIGNNNTVTVTDGGATASALEALKGSLASSQQALTAVVSKIGSTPTPNAPVTTAGDAANSDPSSDPKSTAKTAATQTALMTISAVVGAVLLIWTLFFKKKSA